MTCAAISIFESERSKDVKIFELYSFKGHVINVDNIWNNFFINFGLHCQYLIVFGFPKIKVRQVT